VPRMARIVPGVIAGAAIMVADAPAQAQANLDAGKSAAQIFADTCNACHRSPREIKATNAGFLRQHYTTGPREAAALAAYLASVGTDTRAVQQRRPPVLGAGQAASPGADQAKPADTQAGVAGNGRRAPEQGQPSAGADVAGVVRPRRPSESVEAGNLPIAGAQGRGAEAAPAQAAVAPARQPAVEDFEE
jgi:hypothetical protein